MSKHADHLPSGPDLRPPGHRSGQLDASRLGRPCRLAPAPRCMSAFSRGSDTYPDCSRMRLRRPSSIPAVVASRPAALGLGRRSPGWVRSKGGLCLRADRKAERPIAHLEGIKGILQVDSYAGCRTLADHGGLRLACCWSHVRRNFKELVTPEPAPIAGEARTDRRALHRRQDIDIRGRSAERTSYRSAAKSRFLVNALEPAGLGSWPRPIRSVLPPPAHCCAPSQASSRGHFRAHRRLLVAHSSRSARPSSSRPALLAHKLLRSAAMSGLHANSRHSREGL